MTSNGFAFAFCWIDCLDQGMWRILSSRVCLELSHDEQNRIVCPSGISGCFVVTKIAAFPQPFGL